MSAPLFATRRRWAAIVYEIILDGAPQPAEWDPGPLPLPIPKSEDVTDTTWRRRSIHARAQEAVYGDSRRWHRTLDRTDALPGTAMMPTAVEVLRLTPSARADANALMVVHVTSDADGLLLVASLRHCARDLTAGQKDDLRRALGALSPRRAQLSPECRSATVLVFATHAPGTRSALPSGWDGNDETWTVLDQWRWSLAAASPPTRRSLGAPAMPPTPGELVRMPRRDAQVLAHGIAILATRPDTRAAAATDYDFDFVGTASIFVDVLLLGITQRIRLAQLANEVGSLADPVARPGRMRVLQREVRVFRNQLWWREASTWRWPDMVLRAYQNEHRLTDALDQLLQDMSDFGAEVRAAADQRFGEFLGIIALIGIPAVAASILQALGANTETAATWLVVVAAVVAPPLLWLSVRVIRSFFPSRSRW